MLIFIDDGINKLIFLNATSLMFVKARIYLCRCLANKYYSQSNTINKLVAGKYDVAFIDLNNTNGFYLFAKYFSSITFTISFQPPLKLVIAKSGPFSAKLSKPSCVSFKRVVLPSSNNSNVTTE